MRAPDDIIPVGNILGEGILWDSRRRRLWWTDIEARRLHRYDLVGGKLEIFETPERIGSFGLIARSERVIVAFASGIAIYEPAGRTVEWLYAPDPSMTGVRFNDGRVDRCGRFWAGTMVEDDRPEAAGCLYSLQGSGAARCHLQNLSISNGLCVSPDGTRLYHADSPTRLISVYELLEPQGALGERRAFAHTPEGAYPDGAAVDAEGCVWSAHWGAGCVVRYTPQGRIDRILEVPARQPSCVCFGGPDLDLLCVTSARAGLDPVALRLDSHAGNVFLYRLGVQGLPEPEFLLER
jgi:sugar lactone lactonase YvrE